jgi:hypothetical protein
LSCNIILQLHAEAHHSIHSIQCSKQTPHANRWQPPADMLNYHRHAWHLASPAQMCIVYQDMERPASFELRQCGWAAIAIAAVVLLVLTAAVTTSSHAGEPCRHQDKTLCSNFRL